MFKVLAYSLSELKKKKNFTFLTLSNLTRVKQSKKNSPFAMFEGNEAKGDEEEY